MKKFDTNDLKLEYIDNHYYVNSDVNELGEWSKETRGKTGSQGRTRLSCGLDLSNGYWVLAFGLYS